MSVLDSGAVEVTSYINNSDVQSNILASLCFLMSVLDSSHSEGRCIHVLEDFHFIRS